MSDVVQDTAVSYLVIVSHPGEYELYGVSFDGRMPAGVKVTSAEVTETNPGAVPLEIAGPTPNPTVFKDDRQKDVPVRRGVWFRASGGSAGGPDRRIKVKAHCSDGFRRVIVCRLRLKA